MHILFIGVELSEDELSILFSHHGLPILPIFANTQEEIESKSQEYTINFAIITYYNNEHEHAWLIDHCLAKKIPVIAIANTSAELARQLFATKSILDYIIPLEFFEDTARQIVQIIHRYRRNQNIVALVVDDSNAFRSHVAFLLTTRGLKVLTSSDGEEALDVIDKNPIRLLVTDYQMPKLDGLGLVKYVRKTYLDDQIAIIAFTASEGKYTAEFLKNGASDFLNKPFTREELTCRIDKSLDILFLMDQLKDSADRDVLTELHNRRYFTKHAPVWFEKKKVSALAMLDIDFFKKINDGLGHDAGDEALKTIAQVINTELPSSALVARLGGEEFCILLTDQSDDQAIKTIENLRKSVEQIPVFWMGKNFHQTISIGLVLQSHLSENLNEAMMLADKLLYMAKHSGRNQVQKSSPKLL